MRADQQQFSNLEFRVAEDDLRHRVLQLRAEIYSAELGHPGVDEYDDVALQLCAVDASGEIVSGLRVIGPGGRLEIEQFVPLNQLVSEGRRPAQIGGFFVTPAKRDLRLHGLVPLAMLRFAYVVGIDLGATDFIMRTHLDGLRKLYRLAYFRLVEGVGFVHPIWGPVYVMRLDLVDVRDNETKFSSPIGRFLRSGNLPGVKRHH